MGTAAQRRSLQISVHKLNMRGLANKHLKMKCLCVTMPSHVQMNILYVKNEGVCNVGLEIYVKIHRSLRLVLFLTKTKKKVFAT